MTSTRLPGKVMADIAGKPLLQRMIERVALARSIDRVVVATTTNAQDDPVAALAEELDAGVFRGDEADVLGRIYAAATTYDADPVVRLTADCPMADPAVIDAALKLYSKGEADYVSNCTRRTFPDGLDVEVMSLAALTEANDTATHPELREHVTPYIRGSRPDLAEGAFRRSELLADSDFGHIRFTVDTEEDYARVRSLFERLPEGFHWLDAVALATRGGSSSAEMTPPSTLHGLLLRPAEIEDARILFRWLNESDRRGSSLVTAEPVAWGAHCTWLLSCLENGDGYLAMAVHDGHAVGQYRLDAGERSVTVSIYVDALFRGRGAGYLMLEDARAQASKRWPGLPLDAKVRKDNPGSLKFFRSAGYTEMESHREYAVLRLEPGAGDLA